jgi:hypothetical protein
MNTPENVNCKSKGNNFKEIHTFVVNWCNNFYSIENQQIVFAENSRHR